MLSCCLWQNLSSLDRDNIDLLPPCTLLRCAPFSGQEILAETRACIQLLSNESSRPMWLVWNWEEPKNYHLRLIAGILCHTKYIFLMLDWFSDYRLWIKRLLLFTINTKTNNINRHHCHLGHFHHHHHHPHHGWSRCGINQSVCRSSYLNTSPDTGSRLLLPSASSSTLSYKSPSSSSRTLSERKIWRLYDIWC